MSLTSNAHTLRGISATLLLLRRLNILLSFVPTKKLSKVLLFPILWSDTEQCSISVLSRVLSSKTHLGGKGRPPTPVCTMVPFLHKPKISFSGFSLFSFSKFSFLDISAPYNTLFSLLFFFSCLFDLFNWRVFVTKFVNILTFYFWKTKKKCISTKFLILTIVPMVIYHQWALKMAQDQIRVFYIIIFWFKLLLWINSLNSMFGIVFFFHGSSCWRLCCFCLCK